MRWTDTPDGCVSDEGYVIKGLELYVPSDPLKVVIAGFGQHQLKTFSEAHLMAVSILGVEDRNMRIDVAKEAARNFLTMYKAGG